MAPMAPRSLASLLVAVLVAGGCASGSDDDSTAASGDPFAGDTSVETDPASATSEPFAGDPFYVPPEPLPAGVPGDVIALEEVESPWDDTTVWRVLHLSEKVSGEPVAVSGLLMAPAEPPAEPLPILALAHGTTGLGDQCAPSVMFTSGGRGRLEVGNLPEDVRRNHVVVATDYEGLGPPGPHPYLVGPSAGRNVLDSIRAAIRADVGAAAGSPAIVWGHSQGGAAALMTAELADDHAPELHLVGVAAGAPAGDVSDIDPDEVGEAYLGFVPMIFSGLRAAYPDVDLSAVLTDAGLAAVDDVEDQCVAEVITGFSDAEPTDLLRTDLGAGSEAIDLLARAAPATRALDVPALIYHGLDDDLVPAASSARMVERYCAAGGAPVERTTYEGRGHVDVIFAAFGDLFAYLGDRIDGAPAPTSC